MNKTHTSKDATVQDATGDSGNVVDGGVVSESTIDSLDMTQRRTWDAQESFLASYALAGTIVTASKVAHVSRQAVYNWISGNVLEFKRRFEVSKYAFREGLERIMFDRLGDPSGNRGSDILLICALKAHWRDKYGDESRPVDDSARTVLNTLIGWRKGNGAASS